MDSLMRLTATLGALAALMIPSLVLAGEGFVGVTAGITDSQISAQQEMALRHALITFNQEVLIAFQEQMIF